MKSQDKVYNKLLKIFEKHSLNLNKSKSELIASINRFSLSNLPYSLNDLSVMGRICICGFFSIKFFIIYRTFICNRLRNLSKKKFYLG